MVLTTFLMAKTVLKLRFFRCHIPSQHLRDISCLSISKTQLKCICLLCVIEMFMHLDSCDCNQFMPHFVELVFPVFCFRLYLSYVVCLFPVPVVLSISTWVCVQSLSPTFNYPSQKGMKHCY